MKKAARNYLQKVLLFGFGLFAAVGALIAITVWIALS